MPKSLKKLAVLRYPLLVILCFTFFLTALSRVDDGQREERARQMEDTLRQAAVACYAAEGIYPPNLAYLQEHYNIHIDSHRWAVHYEIFAANLMPEITVVELP